MNDHSYGTTIRTNKSLEFQESEIPDIAVEICVNTTAQPSCKTNCQEQLWLVRSQNASVDINVELESTSDTILHKRCEQGCSSNSKVTVWSKQYRKLLNLLFVEDKQALIIDFFPVLDEISTLIREIE